MKRCMGYTILESAFVLMILALFFGALLVGQDLIDSARQQQLYRDFDIYKTAIISFEAKYGALPGNFTEAEDFWGTQDECGGSDDLGVCNGSAGTFWDSGSQGTQGWRHLGRAGLIPALYAGEAIPSDNIPGINFPPAPINEGAFALSRDNISGNNYDLIRAGQLNAGAIQKFGILSPDDAYSFDSKYDDGLPLEGFLAAMNAVTDPCIDGTEYDLGNDDTLDCIMRLLIHRTVDAP